MELKFVIIIIYLAFYRFFISMFPNCGVQVRIQKLSFQIYLLSDFDSEIITECTEIFSLGNKAAKSLKYLGSRLVVVFKRALDHDFEKKLLGSE